MVIGVWWHLLSSLVGAPYLTYLFPLTFAFIKYWLLAIFALAIPMSYGLYLLSFKVFSGKVTKAKFAILSVCTLFGAFLLVIGIIVYLFFGTVHF
jgi:hypothetical protein